ncbi:hypothetical protein [Singulisphaera sp. PoT]|uniref:hypothetical protein n=1 Tax=Singulisphaera sp. PoT TaxID=3411797 RepID=UPI003BF4CCB0
MTIRCLLLIVALAAIPTWYWTLLHKAAAEQHARTDANLASRGESSLIRPRPVGWESWVFPWVRR